MNEKNLKTAIVTGGASGIGLEIALSFKEQGYNSICFDLNPPLEDAGIYFVKF